MISTKIDAILFDMDGVLVDSLDSWWQSLSSAFENYGHGSITRDEFIDKYWGRDLRINLEKKGINQEILSFCNRVYGDYISFVKIYSDTRDTLEKLRDFKKCIITNTPRSCTDQVVKSLDIKKYFDNIVTSDDVAIGKPDPEIVFKACNLLDVKPENSIMIGDTIADIQAGKKAGCKVIGVKIQADYKINNLSELIPLLTEP